MKKLILVAVLLVLVLLLSWWAKGANFSILTMMQSVTRPQIATQSAVPNISKTFSPTLTPVPVEILITVTPNGFVPDVIMIASNTKITWVNKSGVIANVSSDLTSVYPQLNLGDFNQNGSVSLTFPKAGRYNYFNNKNPMQKGTLVVK